MKNDGMSAGVTAHTAVSLACLLAASSVLAAADADFETKRAAMLAHDRTFIYNNDGCDIFYYPGNRPITEKAFRSLRLDFANSPTIASTSYCPNCGGFDFFSTPGIGYFNANFFNKHYLEDVHHTYAKGEKRLPGFNGAPRFRDELGTDALTMYLNWAREHGKETFISFRMNDKHDTDDRYGHLFYSPFKILHPECMMGSRRNPAVFNANIGSWSCVDYTNEIVQTEVCAFVRQFAERYDVDGLEYDFCRHPFLTRTAVCTGEPATKAECDAITSMMKRLRAITEEIGRKRGRPILISVRTPDNPVFAKAIGMDLNAWFGAKTVDIWIASFYFQLEPWTAGVAFARRYGVKFIASMDESRIPTHRVSWGFTLLPGRGSLENYRARYAAALAAGADGLWLFNLEYGQLRRYTEKGARELDGENKLYFATERCCGALHPQHLQKNWRQYWKMPEMCPRYGHRIVGGEPFAFEIEMGDDFGKARTKGRMPTVSAIVMADGLEPGDCPTFEINGAAFGKGRPAGTDVEVYEKADRAHISVYRVPTAAVRLGANRFTVRHDRDFLLRDFAVRIVFSDGSEKTGK